MSLHDAGKDPQTQDENIVDGEDVGRRSTEKENRPQLDRSAATTLSTSEVILVDFDGPDDPKNPKK